MRNRCDSCLKLSEACFCHTITSISNHKKIIILQSKEESKHILNTGIMAKLTFQNISIYNDEPFFKCQELLNELSHSKACLFKPHSESLSFESSHGDFDTLIFIDATWKKANKIFFENEFLSLIPKVSFTTHIESQYFLRKEPKKNYISTFEAAVHAIEIDQGECYKSSLAPLKFIQEFQNKFI
jgi:DTW domain-containing protein YfiP